MLFVLRRLTVKSAKRKSYMSIRPTIVENGRRVKTGGGLFTAKYYKKRYFEECF
jgi:hypothetical protein